MLRFTYRNNNSHKNKPKVQQQQQQQPFSDNPFSYNTRKSTVMYLQPIYDTYSGTYQQVITFSNVPSGPLQDLVYTMISPRKSIFEDNPTECIYVLSRFSELNHKIENKWMKFDDIGEIYNYLMLNGYVIDTHFSQLLHHVGVNGNRRIICTFTYIPPV
jgi:hypothetical protein